MRRAPPVLRAGVTGTPGRPRARPGIFPRQARGPTRRLVGADVSSPHAAPRAWAGSAAVGGARPLLSPSAPGGLRGEQSQVSQGREQRSETRPPTPLSRVLAHLAAPVQEACEGSGRRRGLRAAGRRRCRVSVRPRRLFPPTNACLRRVRSLRQDRGLSAGAAGPRFPGHTPGRSRNGPLPWGSAGAGRRATRSGRRGFQGLSSCSHWGLSRCRVWGLWQTGAVTGHF